MTRLDAALQSVRSTYTTPDGRDEALAVVEVETWHPWDDLARALRRLAWDGGAARRREARERWHRGDEG